MWTTLTTRLAAPALVALAVATCAPPDAPVAPPPDLAPLPPAVTAPEIDEPYLPPVPTVTAGPRGPMEMTLVVRAETTAAEAGALVVAAPPRLVLTLAPCHFTEAEPDFEPVVSEQDCRAVNRTSFEGRSQRALVVPPGDYEIEVHNAAFDRDLGFWLRREDDWSISAVSAGGVPSGGSRSWLVSLTPGRWIYSCPLSPTPDYLLIVR